jgi:hypothetical protein
MTILHLAFFTMPKIFLAFLKQAIANSSLIIAKSDVNLAPGSKNIRHSSLSD